MDGSGLRLIAAVALASLLLPPAAHAQAPIRDPAAAEVLFRAGVEALRGQDPVTACTKFQASLELDPAVATLLQVAECHERKGRLARAWADVSRAMSLNRDTPGDQRRRELHAYADQLLRRLDRRLPRLRITVADPPEGLAIRRDHVVLPSAALGEAIPADPGPVTIEVTAPGHAPARRELTLVEGQTTDVAFTLLPASGAGQAAAAGERAVPAWAWVSAGAGLVLLGISAGFAVSQSGTQAEIDRRCPPPDALCLPGYDPSAANERLYRDFGLFVGAGALGALTLGAGVLGIALAPKALSFPPSPPGPGVAGIRLWGGPAGVGASLSGVF